MNIPDFYHYESDEFSDYFPVAGDAAGVASAPDLSPRTEGYTRVRLKSVSSGHSVALSNESDGWLMAITVITPQRHLQKRCIYGKSVQALVDVFRLGACGSWRFWRCFLVLRDGFANWQLEECDVPVGSGLRR